MDWGFAKSALSMPDLTKTRVHFLGYSLFLTIHSLFEKNKNGDYCLLEFTRHKVKRFFLELFPALVLVAIIDSISILSNGDKYPFYRGFNLKAFVGNLLMLQGTLVNKIPGVAIIQFGSCRPIWALSVEWWFYFCVAILFFMIVNKEKMDFKRYLVFMAVIGICSEYFIGGTGRGLGFVFCLGILAYFVYEMIEYRTSVFSGGISCVLYLFYGLNVKEAYTVYSFLILWGIFISFLRMTMNLKLKYNKYVSAFSRSTFMLYLLHYGIIDMIYRNSSLGMGSMRKFVIGIIVSLVISQVMYYAFGEKKLLLKCYRIVR